LTSADEIMAQGDVHQQIGLREAMDHCSALPATFNCYCQSMRKLRKHAQNAPRCLQHSMFHYPAFLATFNNHRNPTHRALLIHATSPAPTTITSGSLAARALRVVNVAALTAATLNVVRRVIALMAMPTSAEVCSQ
jgi:hypothetical protein